MLKLSGLIKDVKFKKYKSHRHVMDVPMFSIFVYDRLDPAELDREVYSKLEEIKKTFAEARNQIHKMGFPSMHSNVLITKLSDVISHHTGTIGVAGQAHRKTKHMSIDIESISVDVIVHEWAHLWMMNNSKEFKNAIRTLYDKLMLNTAADVRSEHIPEWKPNDQADRRMLTMWSNWSELLVKFTVNEPSAQWYFWKGKKVESGNLEFLPQGIVVEGVLTLPLNVETLHAQSKILPKGSRVYAEKGNSGWIIGQQAKEGKYETVTKGFLAILDVMKAPRGRTDMFQELDKVLRLSVARNPEYKTTTYLTKSILEKIQSAMKHSMDNMLKFAVVSQESRRGIDDMIKAWAQYVLPKYLEILKNKDFIPFYRHNLDKAYDFLWVSNELKPKDLSAINVVREAKRKDLVRTYSDTFAKRKNLSGEEYGSHRDIMHKLQKWVNAYGMSDEQELWASAIELFFKLPSNYRKAIIGIMMGHYGTIKESINNEIRTEHFFVKFGMSGVGKNVGKIFLGNICFGYVYKQIGGWGKFVDKWLFNRESEITKKLGFPIIWDKGYDTVQSLLDDLEKWYKSKYR